MADTTKTIHLNLYGAEAERILRVAFAFMSKYGKRGVSFTANKTEIGRADDGEITLLIRDTHYWSAKHNALCNRKTDAACREWVADYLKAAAKCWIGFSRDSRRCSHTDLYSALVSADPDWKPTNRGVISAFDVAPKTPDDKPIDVSATVRGVYCLYDFLKGRAGSADKYGKDEVAAVKGEPYDPVRTEMQVALREMIAGIEEQRAAELNRLETEMYRELEKVRNEYSQKRDKVRNDATKQIEDAKAAMSVMAADGGTTPAVCAA